MIYQSENAEKAVDKAKNLCQIPFQAKNLRKNNLF